MGYLSSMIGKPLKWLGGATALYGSYKLATENSGEVTESLGGAAQGLQGGNEFDAIYGFLDSTSEQMDSDPEYGSNLKTAGTGLAAGLIGAYLDGSFSRGDVPVEGFEPEAPESGSAEAVPQPDPDSEYTAVGRVEKDGDQYMAISNPDEEGSGIYAVPMDDFEQYQVSPRNPAS